MSNNTSISRRDFLKLAVRSSALVAAAHVAAPGLLGTALAERAYAASNAGAIVCPRVVNPAFVEPGGTFTVEVRGDRGLSTNGWTVSLQNDLRVTWPCSVEQATYTNIDNGRDTGWQLLVRVSPDAAPELMHLGVAHTSVRENTSLASHAVSVVNDLNAPFYALHLTDEHVMRERQSDIPNAEDRSSGFRTAQLVSWATPVVNLLNPRIVINSGDQVTRFATTGYEYSLINNIYGCYFKAKRGYRVPSTVVLGNHEVNEKGDRAPQYADWEREAGQRYFTVRMGSFAIFGHDYTDTEAKRWTSETYASLWRQGDITGRMVVQHFTDWNAVRIPDDMPATLMLIGHLHNHNLVKQQPFPVLMSVAGHRYGRAGYLAFERDSQGRWNTRAQETWSSGSFVGLVGENGTPRAWVVYDKPNDGSAQSNRVVINNKLNRAFPDGRVRLLMDDGSYDVQGGEILSSYAFLDAAGRLRRAVDVRVNMRPNTTVAVTIVRGSATASYAAADSRIAREPVAVDANGTPKDLASSYPQPTTPPPSGTVQESDPAVGTQRVWLPVINT